VDRKYQKSARNKKQRRAGENGSLGGGDKEEEKA